MGQSKQNLETDLTEITRVKIRENQSLLDGLTIKT